MAVTNWYVTASTFAGLSGYDQATADKEVSASTTAPGSGTLSASIAAGATEAFIAVATVTAPHGGATGCTPGRKPSAK